MRKQKQDHKGYDIRKYSPKTQRTSSNIVHRLQKTRSGNIVWNDKRHAVVDWIYSET